jgi:hypothetical protein
MTITKENLNYFQNLFFNIIIFTSYFLLFISLLGVSSAAKYLDELSYYIRIYICLFLIWRFNPIRSNYEFNDLDGKIAFSAGLFILSTTALNNYIVYIQNKAKNVTTKITNKFKDNVNFDNIMENL